MDEQTPEQPPQPPQQPAQPQQPQQPKVVHLHHAPKPEIGEVISKAFGVFGRHFLGVVLTSAVLFLPFVLYASSVIDNSISKEELEEFQIITGLGGFVCSLLLTSIITCGTVKELETGHVSYGDTLKQGLGSLGAAILATLLYIIAIAAGFIALIIPGIIAVLVWYVAIPAAVVERQGTFNAFTRSAALTKGWRWQLLGLFLIVALIGGATSAIVSGLAGNDIQNQIFVGIAVQIVYTPFGAILPAVVYHELRQSGGGTLDDLGKIFE